MTTLIAAIAVAVKEDGRVNIRDLAAANGASYGTILNILHNDLGLVKKSARWVPKLLSDEQSWKESGPARSSLPLFAATLCRF